jgi:hypothetical protein
MSSSPQLSSAGAADGSNQLRPGEKEKIKPLVVLAAAVAAIGGKLHVQNCKCISCRLAMFALADCMLAFQPRFVAMKCAAL